MVGGGGLFDFRVTPNPNFMLDVNLDVEFDNIIVGNIVTARILLKSQLGLSTSFTHLLTSLLVSDSFCILMTFVIFSLPKLTKVKFLFVLSNKGGNKERILNHYMML